MSGRRVLRQIGEIARRDFVQRAKSRAFLITTLITVGLVLSVGPLLSMQLRDPAPYRVGIVGTAPAGFEADLRAAADAVDRTVVMTPYATVAEAERGLDDGQVGAVVARGSEVIWTEEPSAQLAAVINAALHAGSLRATAAELELTTDEVSRLVAPPPPSVRTLRDPDPEAEPRRIGAMVGAILLYLSILMFGQFVMLGVVEEKSSRVVEVLLSRVAPARILAGKVIGVGLLGLTQLVLFGGTIWLALTQIDIADVSLGAVGASIVFQVVAWYLVGYAFFATLYGALGATISRQEDVQSMAMIPVILLLPGYFISIILPENPEMVLGRVASIIPPTSPLVMPIRLAVTSVPLWELLVTLGLLAAAAFGMIRFGARIYSGAVLKIGPKVRLREAWRSASR